MTSMGAEHALLSYHYLDEGDVEGYASLVDRGALFEHPGHPVARGPRRAAELVLDRYGSRGTHRPHHVVAAQDDVVVIGTLNTRDAESGRESTQEFADFFVINEHGLLTSWRRFHTPTE